MDKMPQRLKDDNNNSNDGVDMVMSNTRTLLLRYQRCLVSHFIATDKSQGVADAALLTGISITSSFFLAFHFPRSKRTHRAMLWPRIGGLSSESWCLAEGQWNGDQRRPMGRKAREGLYSFFTLFSITAVFRCCLIVVLYSVLH